MSFHDVDLGRVPTPRYDPPDVDRYNRLPLQTPRGCPLDCEFWAASRVFGGFKKKPVARVAGELRDITRCLPHPLLELADDNTSVDRPWSRERVRAIAAAEVHWFTQTDVSGGDDPELLDLLELEQGLGISIPEAERADLRTVGAAVRQAGVRS